MAMTRGERNVLFHSAWFKITAGVIDCAIKNETASCDWHKRAHMRPLETHELNLCKNSSQHQSTKITKKTLNWFPSFALPRMRTEVLSQNFCTFGLSGSE